ncbi:hypothetical protein QYM36_014091 [Artemia franciscana]|uniref:Uncharacterized protein n=1 Tax=Artemia franciscana TaxID=6661 RepID=A0AA88HME0_ARTSF|nr:hypothetical protein QYM36_014091 [Artemia franciscana]
MERMKQLHPFVEILAKAKPKLRRALLQNLDKDIVKAFSELCLNITNSNISMPLCQKKRCSQHRKIIRDLSVKKKNIKQKRRKLVQPGSGFFGVLLPIIGSLIGSVLTRNGSSSTIQAHSTRDSYSAKAAL